LVKLFIGVQLNTKKKCKQQRAMDVTDIQKVMTGAGELLGCG